MNVSSMSDDEAASTSGDGAARATESSAERTDPVRARYEGSHDLYGVASWEPRTALDSVAVGVHGLYRALRGSALVTLGLALLVLQLALTGFLVFQRPVIGALAVLSVLPALGLVAYIWKGDPTHREPLPAMAVTFGLAILFAGLAAVVNTVAGLPFEFIPGVGMALYFFIVVGPIEEAVKLLAVRAHAYQQPSFDAVVDGVVYGAVAGLGFATIENLSYISQGYLRAASIEGIGGVTLAFGTAAQRAFVGPGHVLWSALAGYYLGLARFDDEHGGPVAVKGLLVAAGIHGVYNTVVSTASLTGLQFLAFVLVFNGAVLAVILRKVGRYRSLYLAEES